MIWYVTLYHLVLLKKKNTNYISKVIDQSISTALWTWSSLQKWLQMFYWKMKSLLLVLKNNTFWFWQKEMHFCSRNFLTADHNSDKYYVSTKKFSKGALQQFTDQGSPQVHCSNTSTISSSLLCVCHTHIAGGFGC